MEGVNDEYEVKIAEYPMVGLADTGTL